MKVSVREKGQTKFNLGDYFVNEYGEVRRIVRGNFNKGYAACSIETGVLHYDESTIDDLLLNYDEAVKVNPVEIKDGEIIFE